MNGFTEAKIRALNWLPDDGSWKGKAGRLNAALSSLGIYHRKLMEFRSGAFGPRGGWVTEFRLTEAGIKAKKSLEGAP